MPVTRLRRRLGEAYGIGLPVEPAPPPQPVEQYWAFFRGGSFLQHYHYTVAGGLVLQVEHTNLPNDDGAWGEVGFYDASRRRYWGRHFLPDTGTWVAASADLDSGSTSVWDPALHIAAAANRLRIDALYQVGQTAVWLVHAPDLQSLTIRYYVVVAPLSGSVLSAGVVTFLEVDMPPDPSHVPDIHERGWSTGTRLNVYLSEVTDGVPVDRFVSVTPGGTLLHQPSGRPYHLTDESTANHPLDPDLALQAGPNNVAIEEVAWALGTRGNGDVDPVQLWPTEPPWPAGAEHVCSKMGSPEIMVKSVSGPWVRGLVSGGEGPIEVLPGTANMDAMGVGLL